MARASNVASGIDGHAPGRFSMRKSWIAGDMGIDETPEALNLTGGSCFLAESSISHSSVQQE